MQSLLCGPPHPPCLCPQPPALCCAYISQAPSAAFKGSWPPALCLHSTVDAASKRCHIWPRVMIHVKGPAGRCRHALLPALLLLCCCWCNPCLQSNSKQPEDLSTLATQSVTNKPSTRTAVESKSLSGSRTPEIWGVTTTVQLLLPWK